MKKMLVLALMLGLNVSVEAVPQEFVTRSVNKKEVKKEIGSQLKKLMKLTYDLLDDLSALQLQWAQKADAYGTSLACFGTCTAALVTCQRRATDCILGLLDGDKECCFTGASGTWLVEYRTNLKALVQALGKMHEEQQALATRTTSPQELTSAATKNLCMLTSWSQSLQENAARFETDFAVA